MAREEVEACLATGRDRLIIVDDNLYYRSMRYTFCQLARKYRVGLLTVVINCDIAVALRRNGARSDAERVCARSDPRGSPLRPNSTTNDNLSHATARALYKRRCRMQSLSA